MSRTVTPTPAEHVGRDVLYTYRYLRAGMIALLLMLLFSVGYQWWVGTGRTCFLGSISAYYFTPAHAVFIGSLCALGALLIVHKARTPQEDVLLDFSGFMAWVVAMVPTVQDGTCGPQAPVSADDIAASVRNNISSLIAIAALAALVRWILRRGAGLTALTTRAGRIAALVCAAILAGELAFFLWKQEEFIALSHGIAAVTMIGGVITVMVLNAWSQPSHARGRQFRAIYLTLAVALAIALGGTVTLHLFITGFAHFILVVEVAVILLFGAFWVFQTIELWDIEPAEIQDQVQRTPVPTPAQSASQQ